MLDLLERHGAKATFFLIGTRAAANPALVSEIIRRGHTIGNHTQTHPLGTFWLAGSRRTAREIDECQMVLQTQGVQIAAWFRSPAGIKTFSLRRVLAERQMTLVGWTTRAREHGSTSIVRPLRRLKNKLCPGAILLIHESHRHGAQRIALLSALLEHLAATGFTCVLPKREALRTFSVTSDTSDSPRTLTRRPLKADGTFLAAPSEIPTDLENVVRPTTGVRVG
jgi:peptidoglycan/xylan/chitin deacetylase (PgdA/CDA1 family)